MAIPMAVLCLSLPALAQEYGDFRAVVFHRCYDGDTCTFSIPGLHPLVGAEISVRIRGVDTPEIRGQCEREKRLAREARDALRELLASAGRIDLLRTERGKYFRIVATVSADGRDVSAVLIARGLGRPYEGGRRGSWCR